MISANESERLKIDLPPDEALERSMMVKPPKDWKTAVARKNKMTFEGASLTLLAGILLGISTLGLMGGDNPLSNSKAVINDYVSKQTEAENKVRDYLLKVTPIGASPEQTLKVIKDVLHKSTYGYKKNYYTACPGPPYQEIYIAGHIGIIYDHEQKSFDPVGTDVIVDWFFDDTDHLFNITVKRQPTGP